MNDTRYVYLMETETEGRYKIGYSVNPDNRAKQITADSNQQETIKGVITSFETANYQYVESMFHSRYANCRVWKNREYFDFDNETLQDVIVLFEACKNTVESSIVGYAKTNTERIQRENEQLKDMLSEVYDFINELEPNAQRSLVDSLVLIATRYKRYQNIIAQKSEVLHELSQKIISSKSQASETIKLSVALEALTDMTSPPVNQIRILMHDLVDRLHRLEERLSLHD